MAIEGDGETFSEAEFDRIMQMAIARCRLRFDVEAARRAPVPADQLTRMRDSAFAEPALSVELGNAARVYLALRGPTPPGFVPADARWILRGQDLVPLAR